MPIRVNTSATHVAPLRFEKMTLRGIGPYLEPAELLIRPLTVLCGTNGSGKSTWFNILSLLRLATDARTLPFYFPKDVQHVGVDWLSYLNATAVSSREPYADDPVHGPMFTIGLQFEAAENLTADRTPPFASLGFRPDRESEPHRFLWYGECRQGETIQVRITHTYLSEVLPPVEPSDILTDWDTGAYYLLSSDDNRWGSSIECARIVNAFEVILDGHHSIAFRLDSRDSVFQYRVYLSSGFLGSGSTDHGPECFCIVRPLRDRTFICYSEDGTEDGNCGTACGHIIGLIRDIMTAAFTGVFHLGAIRETAREDKYQRVRGVSRYVGSAGQYAYYLRSMFMHEPMSILAITSRDTDAIAHGVGNGGLQIPFESYYDHWLRNLLGVEPRSVNLEGNSAEDSSSLRSLAEWYPSPQSPHGYLRGLVPDEFQLLPRERRAAPLQDGPSSSNTKRQADLPSDRIMTPDAASNNRYGNAFLGRWSAGPVSFSTGFHQIAPLIVQCGLMRKHEVLTIENPEVHLHPSLQLKLTEYLYEEALTGRAVLIETHSDLVVRRILRAILEEDLPQSQVEIYFVSCSSDISGRNSRLQHVTVDEQGRIDNWPDGFMDEYTRESQRLLDAMYGGGNRDAV